MHKLGLLSIFTYYLIFPSTNLCSYSIELQLMYSHVGIILILQQIFTFSYVSKVTLPFNLYFNYFNSNWTITLMALYY